MNSCSADKNTSEIIIHIRIAKKRSKFQTVLFVTNDQKYGFVSTLTKQQTVHVEDAVRDFVIHVDGYCNLNPGLLRNV